MISKSQFFIIILLITLSSCVANRKLGTVYFQPESPEFFAKYGLKQFLKGNNNPKIVLRVPVSKATSTEEENFSLSPIYNAIERELLKGGFNVRDRGLFNEILKKSDNEDYASIRDLTDTDLILEVVGIDLNVEYNTNKYKDHRGRDVKIFGNISLNGASVDFKIIMINSNELAGTYKFNYAPCSQGCKYYIDKYGNLYTALSGTSEIQPYEIVESNALVEFIEMCTRDLMVELRN